MRLIVGDLLGLWIILGLVAVLGVLLAATINDFDWDFWHDPDDAIPADDPDKVTDSETEGRLTDGSSEEADPHLHRRR